MTAQNRDNTRNARTLLWNREKKTPARCKIKADSSPTSGSASAKTAGLSRGKWIICDSPLPFDRLSTAHAYVRNEGFQEVGFVPQRVMDEPIAERDYPVGEIVLC